MKKNLLFSQRMGFKPIKNILQKDSVDADLRLALWNIFYSFYLEEYNYYSEQLIKLIWTSYFKKPIDEFHKRSDYYPRYVQIIKQHFFKTEWYNIYDIIEIVINNFDLELINKHFIEECNRILEREMAAYRIINKRLVPIFNDEEIKEIEEVLENDITHLAKNHINKALSFLSDRKNPDYLNSIKESIMAVEGVCGNLTKCRSFDEALKEFKKRGIIKIHPSLEEAFKKLYGYSSDEKGIRHSFSQEKQSDISFEEAKFMLVACSAFINYINGKLKDRTNASAS